MFFSFSLSALLHPGVDIFPAFQWWMFLKRRELHNKVTIQKQGFIDNPLSTSRRGWLVICSTWNRSKKFKSVLQREKCIYLRIPELTQPLLNVTGISSNLWKAASNLKSQAVRSRPALPSTQHRGLWSIPYPAALHDQSFWTCFGLEPKRTTFCFSFCWLLKMVSSMVSTNSTTWSKWVF